VDARELGTVKRALWAAADQLRANSTLAASEYRGPVLGLIFLAYAEHRFEQFRPEIEAKATARRQVTPDDYRARSVLFLAEQARLSYLVSLPEREDLGAAVDTAMKLVEYHNSELRDVLPRGYQRLEKSTLVELLRLFAPLPRKLSGGAFGLIYEDFLSNFAMAEGRLGGEFFTPQSVVRLIVEIIEPFHGRVFDPACGSGGMFVQCAKFVERRQGSATRDLAIYGQEQKEVTVPLARMNLAMHGLSGDIRLGNSYYEDLHGSVGAFDFVMANPPFNVNGVDKGKLAGDPRFPYGLPKPDNGNYLWIQLIASALAKGGRGGFVMANSAGDAGHSEREIRRKLIESKTVDVMVAVGTNFFYTVTLPVTLWFLDNGKRGTDREATVLFIDARHLYRQIDRAHRDFLPEQIELLANIVRLYRGDAVETTAGSESMVKERFPDGTYTDVPGLCKVATLAEIETHGWSLNPSRFVGAAATEDDTENFAERLTPVRAVGGAAIPAIHAGPVSSMDAWTAPDGGPCLATASEDGTVRLWDPVTGRQLGDPLTGHIRAVWSVVAWTGSDGVPRLATGGSDSTVRLWDPRTGQQLGEPLVGHTSAVRSVAAWTGPDGASRLATASEDWTVRLWDPLTGQQLGKPLVGHIGAVWSVAALTGSDGAPSLATGGDDGTVWLWDPHTGQQLGNSLTGHIGSVDSVTAWTGPDGAPCLATSGSNRTVLAWHVGGKPRMRSRGFADRPAESDLLGRADLVTVLAEVLGRSDEPTSPDEVPTVVTIEGPWGSGKTTVLGLLAKELGSAVPAHGPPSQLKAAHARRRPPRRRLHAAGRRRLTVGAAARLLRRTPTPASANSTDHRQPRSRQVVAWFNPWAYQSADQIWAGLARTILEAAGPAVHGIGNSAEHYWFSRNLARLDRRGTHRQLSRRTRSPLLAVAFLAFLVPLATQLAIRDSTVSLDGHHIPSGLLALSFPAALLLAGLLHTAGRHLFARASAFLPGDLFTGPVDTAAAARPDTARDAALRDPLFHARSGYLYLVQHDIQDLLEDLAAIGTELIVFIDDLDRCTPPTTAQVLEAINLFLTETFQRARFVIGLDPAVVAAHIDRTYTDLLGVSTILHPGDPTPGWTFLRKLIQLPVALPAVADTSIDELLNHALGVATIRPTSAPIPPSGPTGTPAVTLPTTIPSATTAGDFAPRNATPQPAPTTPAPPSPTGNFRTTTVDNDALGRAIERDPTVRGRLRERLAAQPDRSVREAKRLLTIWQFYVRLFQRTYPLPEPDSLRRAQDLVLVAEIIARWPAHLHVLRRPFPDRQIPPRPALHALVETAHDDHDWATTLAYLAPALADPAINTELRALLRDYNGQHIASLYTRIT
jgi:type I restriction enzyme M protein